MGPDSPRYRVRYRHHESGQLARFNPMGREDAVEVARQIVVDGEWDVQIEDDTGEIWSVEGLAGS